MGGIFKQYGWIFDLLVILICSFFTAKIVSVYLGKSLEVRRSIGIIKTADTEAVSAEEIPLADYKIILDRNIFDSAEVTAEAAEGEAAEGGADEVVSTGEAVKTSLPIKVWAVLVVGDGRDKRSSATIESSSGGKGGGNVDVYSVDADPSFAPGTKLTKIAPDRIEFINNGRLEYAELVGESAASIFAPPSDQAPQVASKEPSAPKEGPLIAATEGTGKFAIDQREVEKALSNVDQLYTEIRAVPNFQGGKMAGMKILSVKSGSVFEKLGLRRGDVLQRINGMELDVRKGFEIFGQLKDLKSFNLDLIRQGQPRTLEYEIR